MGLYPRGGRYFSHGKLSKIDPLVLKSHSIKAKQRTGNGRKKHVEIRSQNLGILIATFLKEILRIYN